MTLRAEIRSAIDQVAPPVPDLRTRALAVVQADRRQGSGSAAARKPMRPFFMGIKHAGAIAAVLLVVLLVVAFFVGGRVLQDWKQFNAPKPVGIDQTVVNQLRAKPLLLPVLKAADNCPASANNPINYGLGIYTDFGDGPIYVVGSSPLGTQWGYYFDVKYVTDPSLKGPVLIRGRDLRTNKSVVFVGAYASGPVLGTDIIGGKGVQQRADAVFDAANREHSNLGGSMGTTPWGIFPILQGIPADFSHCVGIQFDGPGFTEVITTPNG